jgi:RimJ/RimL family protein N-acetyltransferase
MSIPTVKTSRLVLRPFTVEDAIPLHQILSTPGVLQYYPRSDPPDLGRVKRLIQAQLDHWDEHGYGWWAVETESENTFIGWSGLQYLPETDEIEIGYLFSKPYWGKGLATESAKEGIEFGFNQLEIEVIVGIVHPENIASQRVLGKIGLEFQEKAKYFGMECFKYQARTPNQKIA